MMPIKGSIVYELPTLPNYIPPRPTENKRIPPPVLSKMGGKCPKLPELVEPNTYGNGETVMTGQPRSAPEARIFQHPIDPVKYFAQFKDPNNCMKPQEKPVPLFKIIRRSESLNTRKKTIQEVSKFANKSPVWNTSKATADDIVGRILTGGQWEREHLPPVVPKAQRPMNNGINRHLWKKEASSPKLIKRVI
ncbi:uncharacterized protein CELE_ZK380.4 [Caenorhabditis elegans]|uniref:Uncharacterized protein n=1 Tax=Caenorhabditis elegans TaxID=6239 RepID=O61763_CAEEL|nr:Uncharacterized protein CELE_ZK380.4 [Caenorhabditis elegans]CCD72314.2 Uncharacterized protein CELE_ZK380.4 [Caenorhabditis elegans]